jgi:anti-anti-sigma regulatory factor
MGVLDLSNVECVDRLVIGALVAAYLAMRRADSMLEIGQSQTWNLLK